MKVRHLHVLLCSCAVIGVIASDAMGQLPRRASENFTGSLPQIEGDVDPTTITPFRNASSPDDGTVSPNITLNGDGTFTQVTTGTEFAATGYSGPDDGDFISSATGWTWETRFRIDSANDPDRGVWEIYMRDIDSGSQADTRIHFLSTGIDRDASGFGVDAEVPIDLTDDFHTVRAVATTDGLASVWVDGALVLDSLNSLGFTGTNEFVRFGRWGGQARGGTATIDYIRFDTTGPYAPIPEPSSVVLSLLGLASLVWRASRRKT